MRWATAVSAVSGVVLAGALALATAAAETVRVGGTGFAIALMRALGERLTELRPNVQTVVLSSLGTSGGLAALGEGEVELAMAARALTAAEQAKGLREAACAVTPLTFATSRTGAPNVALRELPNLFSAADPRWPDGMPLKVILRSRAGSENGYLAARVPGMGDALAAAFKRPGIAVAATDQENADLAQRVVGSLAVMTVLQVRTERLALHALGIDGQAPSMDAIAAKTWPLPQRFCLIVPTAPTAGARHLVAYFSSPDGQAQLVAAGALLE